MSTSFKTVAAFVGGLVLGVGALSVSSPDQRKPGGDFQGDQDVVEGVPVGAGEVLPDGLLPPDAAAGPPPPPGTPLLPVDGAGKVLPEGMVPGEGTPESGVPGAVPGALPGVAPFGPPDGGPPAGGPGPEGFSTEGKRARPVAGVLLLDEHLSGAEARWFEIRGRTQGVQGGAALLKDIDALVVRIPKSDDGMPPLQEVVGYLVNERLLLDRLAAAGVDVAEASESLDRLLAPPQGKIKGGHEKAAVPGGAGQAPEGTRPLDPNTPRRALDDAG